MFVHVLDQHELLLAYFQMSLMELYGPQYSFQAHLRSLRGPVFGDPRSVKRLTSLTATNMNLIEFSHRTFIFMHINIGLSGKV